jgi:hypothetical protein
MKHTILLVLAVCSTAFADPVKLTNAEASRLFQALRSTRAGLNPVNTTRAAVNINILRPYAENFEQQLEAINAKGRTLQTNDPALAQKSTALTEEARKLSKDAFTVELRPLAITEDDAQIRDAAIPPDALAEFIRFLAPNPQPEKKK